MIRAGDIRDIIGAPARVRVLVVSSDAVNENAYPIVAPILRGHDDIPPYQVTLGPSDSVAGVVNLNWLTTVRPEDLSEPVGTIAGDTWMRVQDCLALLLDLERR